MVRPERFELPTLWFEAKCSIQLSYGRTPRNEYLPPIHLTASIPAPRPPTAEPAAGARSSGSRNHRHCLNDIQPGAAQQLVDHRPGQPAGVILHTHGLRLLVKFHTPHAIYIANLRQRKHSPLGGRRAVAVKNIKLSHNPILPALKPASQLCPDNP